MDSPSVVVVVVVVVVEVVLVVVVVVVWPGYFSRYSDSLQAERSGDRNPARARFFAPVQTGPGAHPASSYTVGTGSFLGLKRPGRGVDERSHLAPRLKKD